MTTTNRPTICFAAAHSGGHILPCLTLAQQLHVQHRVLFLSLDRPLERALLQAAPAIDQLTYLELPKFPYRQFWRYPRFIVQFLRSVRASYQTLKQAQVTRVITTGGVSAIPVCYAAKLLRIPIEVYELNLEPGRAVQLIAPLAQTIKVCFPGAKRHFRANDQARCTVVRYPVRFTPAALAYTKTAVLQTQSDRLAGFTVNRKTIFILGGSQGSAYLNQLAVELLELPLNFPIQVIHQVGDQHANRSLDKVAALQQLYQDHQIPAYVFSYDADLAPLYTLADVVITRAGAGVLAELAFFSRPAVVVPLQTAQTAHQVKNAASWQQLYPQLFRVLEQPALEQEPALLLAPLQELW